MSRRTAGTAAAASVRTRRRGRRPSARGRRRRSGWPRCKLVQVAHLARLRQVRVLQDVERLADGGAAGGGGARWSTRSGRGTTSWWAPGVRRGSRRGPSRASLPGRGLPAGGGVHGRVFDRLDDVVGDVPAVEARRRPCAAQLGVGAGEFRVLSRVEPTTQLPPGRNSFTVSRQAEPGLVGRGLRAEGLVHREAVAGEPLGGPQQRAEPFAAPLVQRLLPGGGGARGADAQSAGDGVGEGQRLAVLREQVGVGAASGAVSRPSMVCTVRVLAS